MKYNEIELGASKVINLVLQVVAVLFLFMILITQINNQVKVGQTITQKFYIFTVLLNSSIFFDVLFIMFPIFILMPFIKGAIYEDINIIAFKDKSELKKSMFSNLTGARSFFGIIMLGALVLQSFFTAYFLFDIYKISNYYQFGFPFELTLLLAILIVIYTITEFKLVLNKIQDYIDYKRDKSVNENNAKAFISSTTTIAFRKKKEIHKRKVKI